MPKPVHPAAPDRAAPAQALNADLGAAPTRSARLHIGVLARCLLFLTPSTEIRSAAKTSLQLLDLYWAVAAMRPELKGRELYLQILQVHAGGDEQAAEKALGEAEQSFASWPAPRPLIFRDVVNYLALSDFLVRHPGEHWTHGDLRRVVAMRIPREM